MNGERGAGGKIHPTPRFFPQAAQGGSRSKRLLRTTQIVPQSPAPPPAVARGDSILQREAIGFSLLLALIWLTEIIGVPHLYFGEPAGFVWPRVLFRTAVVGLIWGCVHWSNRRLLKRLRELEEFLHVCSWCRKVGHGGEWLTMEEYFGSHLNTVTSHGICPACANTQLAATQPTVTRVRQPAS